MALANLPHELGRQDAKWEQQWKENGHEAGVCGRFEKEHGETLAQMATTSVGVSRNKPPSDAHSCEREEFVWAGLESSEQPEQKILCGMLHTIFDLVVMRRNPASKTGHLICSRYRG